MQSIKVSKKTKERIEKTQAELLLDHNYKVNQSELLDKIVEKATKDPNFMDKIFSSQPRSPKPKKELVQVKIISRKKPKIRLYPEEWSD
ncbi:hypothetical protein DSAG12_03048 [Promethearchaeum syntrophicum]|uniref:Uncharacterized protein n=1 Tax=Promethearchaeum syntrophicum TaxID=2594042 RepID=A0A5B9DER7_9ARCH|nr:hypothetical protein [Candidatus Prometheoarchaeum syntrophicum]QEE17216.1 hypothetical protein DSAG12_03048 [Candidatus Prometheoarchaeum syntrophicum]